MHGFLDQQDGGVVHCLLGRTLICMYICILFRGLHLQHTHQVVKYVCRLENLSRCSISVMR